MSINIKACLGCGAPVNGEFNLCGKCSIKSDVGKFAYEPKRDTSLSKDDSIMGTRKSEYSRDKEFMIAFAALSVGAIAVIGHLALVYSHLLSDNIALWFDHLC